ncbi:MAG: N-acetylglucosamine-6-phosphate deacetylase, partial [Leptotrichiaceae bacterium]|nr:N-acetylglucosamine-6-phosphate deacetylase [Leptotrichiaceae bacterium]
MILKNCRIFDGESFISENVIVLKEDKIIKIIFEKDLGEDLMNDEVVDIQGNIISPGFIDLQLNGCGGVL